MTFDWFTFVAQLVNFVLLLILLRVFLYRPVLNIMEQRQTRLSEQWQEAERARQEAAGEAAQLSAQRQQLDAARRDRLDAVELEADRLLARRLEEVEAEVAAIRARQQTALSESREQAVERLRERSAQLLVDELRASLRELADSELEQRTAAAFAKRLRGLDVARQAELSAAARSQVPVVTTAFDPGDSGREHLSALLREQLGEGVAPEFRQDERLLFGIELVVGAQRVAVSGTERLTALSTAFNEALTELAAAAEVERVGN